jgi:putative endonuclease
VVWCESFISRENAFRRERRMKTWNREWKIKLIERVNPGWRDLYEDLF